VLKLDRADIDLVRIAMRYTGVDGKSSSKENQLKLDECLAKTASGLDEGTFLGPGGGMGKGVRLAENTEMIFDCLEGEPKWVQRRMHLR